MAIEVFKKRYLVMGLISVTCLCWSGYYYCYCSVHNLLLANTWAYHKCKCSGAWISGPTNFNSVVSVCNLGTALYFHNLVTHFRLLMSHQPVMTLPTSPHSSPTPPSPGTQAATTPTRRRPTTLRPSSTSGTIHKGSPQNFWVFGPPPPLSEFWIHL